MANKSDEHIVTTTGVNSTVAVDGEAIGHILLLDYDGSSSYLTMREETANLPGINALFESSPGNWHVWNLTVRSRDDTALKMLQLHADEKHTPIGYRRGRWTLRIAQKTRNGGEIYKEPPDMLDVWTNPTDKEQSLPHTRLLEAIARQNEVSFSAPDSVPYTGAGYVTEKYMSITDDMKARLRGDE